MIIALTEASKNTFWKVVKMTDPNLKNQLQKIGVDTGTYLMPLEHIEKTLPVRMRLVGQKKDILISPDMTIHMVVHSSDNQKTSLAEIPVGSSAHLEGVTGEDASLARDLEKLGIIVGVTDFKILRRLPPILSEEAARQAEGGACLSLDAGWRPLWRARRRACPGPPAEPGACPSSAFPGPGRSRAWPARRRSTAKDVFRVQSSGSMIF